MTATSDTPRRAIVLDVVGLEPHHVDEQLAPNIAALLDGQPTAPLEPPFPAVTLPSQTTLATGQSPSTHGDVSNGEYDRAEDTVALWERDRADRNRLWEAVSDETALTTGALFFQHLIGSSADVAVTPSPIEDEDNNLLEMNCWTNPDDFYETLEDEYGHFPLHNYWGPTANEQSSEWILSAARESIERHDPDLLWVYLPHLDYDGQRHGPDSPELREAIGVVDELVGEFLDWLRDRQRWAETAVHIVSEYGFHAVDTPIFPNRALREAGLLSVTAGREGGDAVDLPDSDAFAMVDHQVAHVYTDDSATDRAREVLAELDGVEVALAGESRAEYGLDHPNSGDIVLIPAQSAWFQYYWWSDDSDAPYYATEMDIHEKPGYDPCALFFGGDGLVTLDASKVSGSHGRNDVPGVYGVGGPAAPEGDLDSVDARAVAPTVAASLGVADDISLSFEVSALFE
ncbi:Predicted pyrophosphatase or phosphodiesterase, AlkP superfamily [Halovenus aranensis]|uniref:Predicted pyrophosphatase or phosphodiesterase, AlkP superfamily n=1 Tax=Halovenus aranensis TaxID=890420 RepID=A0A1G8VR10_9EURY|nr:nucleotide pyrophosphatase/phosphodiesterase family protein [Halovenus aranensis]SDJ67630.1 Predicted pyrophosphatase or phosphodiesterase, AlkP superfamily [Halovenus aranensis]